VRWFTVHNPMSPLARVLVFGICGVTGYLAAGALTSPPSSPPPLPAPAVPATPLLPAAQPPPGATAENSLLREWEQLRSARGTAAEFPALYGEIKEMGDSFRRRAFRSALVAEWAVLDPQAALVFLQEKDKGVIGQLLREWMRVDPQASINALLTGGDKTRGNLRELLGEIARVAPERLHEVVAVLPKSDNRWDTTTQDAFAIFAGKNPDAARTAAEAITGPLRGQALAGIAKAWGEKDGAQALTWADALPPGEERDAALKAALIGWAKSDPVAALAHLNVVPPGGDEMQHASDAGAQVLREAAKRDWDATVRWLRENPGKLGRSSLNGLENAISKRLAADPAGTMHMLAQSGVAGFQGVLANSVLNEGYAQRDAIWKWLDDQPVNDFTRAARGSLLNAIGWKEPAVALGFLEKLPDTPENRELLQQGTRSLFNGGSQIHRIEELLAEASPKLRTLMIETGFDLGFNYQHAGFDPARWVPRINELPENRRENAFNGLARGWAGSDPEAAINWALSLTNPAQRDSAFDAATNGWAAADPHEAAEWVNSIPAGTQRDVASSNLVASLARSEPESAWTWALSIGDAGHKMRALQVAYGALRKKDSAIAQQMLRSANLSAHERTLLTQSSGR